jgi:hypothetical protein
MNKRSQQNHSKSESQTMQTDRAAIAARDPGPGAKNRPGFDLGGAVGDAKPDDKSRIENSTVQAQDAVEEQASRLTSGSQSKAEGKIDRKPGKMRSAVAGVKNWLRRK